MFNGLATFGQATVAMQMLVVGGGLASIPPLSTAHWPTITGVVLAKMVVAPGISAGVMYGIKKLAMTPDFPRQSDFIVACVVACTPTSNSLNMIAELGGGPSCKEALSTMIFCMLFISPVTVTLGVIIFQSL